MFWSEKISVISTSDTIHLPILFSEHTVMSKSLVYNHVFIMVSMSNYVLDKYMHIASKLWKAWGKIVAFFLGWRKCILLRCWSSSRLRRNLGSNGPLIDLLQLPRGTPFRHQTFPSEGSEPAERASDGGDWTGLTQGAVDGCVHNPTQWLSDSTGQQR